MVGSMSKMKLSYPHRSNQFQSMKKIEQDNDVTDCIDAVYT